MPFFKAVLLDWVGTLIVPKWGPTRGRPRGASWIERSLTQVGWEASSAEVARISAALSAAGKRPDVAEGWAGADLSAAAHQESYLRWVMAAGLDCILAEAMYEALCDAVDNVFAVDVEPTLGALKAAGVKVAIVSDIHVDIRPGFAKAGLDTHVDDFVLSFERGACKPDPAIFRTALERLGVQPHETLMVGDRSGHDGAAVEAGITTLLVPPLTHATEKRLHLVLAACGVAGC
ncbi:HAD family hydrolase [Streptacidiphilus pinicola]|uniref:HAD family hydrolase n=1 Tax=Streptacidiphilus pinicola TaxID=2219663 RepID=A0A2X0JYE6_9ACTN|nr:HAD family hydrolase [Streptacidiphilus pinicola]RAG81975.1 HAD family hydrolase [Streptacidiphilus pinicola]